ncbi:MAG TPA: hypothetical protein VF122_05940, partial [Caulobacteraceae bacterium]
MTFAERLRARLHQAALAAARHDGRWVGALAAISVGAGMGVIVDAAAQVRTGEGLARSIATAISTAPLLPAQPRPVTLRWEGKDIDGDGAADFVNPTGKQVRRED